MASSSSPLGQSGSEAETPAIVTGQANGVGPETVEPGALRSAGLGSTERPLPSSRPLPSKRPAQPTPESQGPSAAVDEQSAAALVAAELAARRRRWPALVVGLAAGAAAAYGVLTYLDGRETQDGTDAAEAVVVATAPVERRDLLEEVEWAGTLQYGAPIEIAGSGGTITGATPVGTALERGDTIASVDGQAVVVLYGQRPLWRTLRQGVEGVDVFLLESNLVALGYDPDVTVTVDQEFTANTELMVERWQEDIGRDVSGIVAVSDVVLIPGPAVVTSEAQVGAAAQGTLATISSDRTVTDIVSAVVGQVSSPAAAGTPLEHGTVLYHVDDVPVTAVTTDRAAADPVLDVLTSVTFTTLELEQALADAGHDPDLEMTVDGSVTAATTAAIERWQAAVDLPVTGRYEPGYYFVVPTGQTVDGSVLAEEASGALRPVLTASNSELRVEIVVGVADADEFEQGQAVSIELADESVVDGAVVAVGVVERANPQADPTVTIVIEVLAGSDQELVEGNATVTTISEAIIGATAVPTRSLISLAEGGFAVEVVAADGETRLVGVELGAFDDGYVEVTEGDLSPGDDESPGDQVVVPQ